MQKIKSKTGLALGAIIALVGSMFAVTVPAQAAPVESAAVISPTGAGADSANEMLITERFELRVRYGSGVIGADNTAANSASGTATPALMVHYSATSTSGLVFSSSPAPAMRLVFKAA